jgi:hypothetical protein
MIVFTTEETDLLDRIAIDMELDRLSPVNRALITLRVVYDLPDDYTGPWPPKYADTGRYVGHRYTGKPLSATRTQNRITQILTSWRRKYHRPSPSSSPTILIKAA